MGRRRMGGENPGLFFYPLGVMGVACYVLLLDGAWREALALLAFFGVIVTVLVVMSKRRPDAPGGD